MFYITHLKSFAAAQNILSSEAVTDFASLARQKKYLIRRLKTL